MEFEHAFGYKILRVNRLYKIIEYDSKRSLLSRCLNYLPNAVGNGAEGRIEMWLEAVRHNRVQCWTEMG